jgi:Uma2 family endonuclease
MVELLERKITVQEFRDMEFPENDPFIYELINGVLMKKQAQTSRHQTAVTKILFAFEMVVQTHDKGFAFTAPIDVSFDKHNNTQPDVIFIKKERDFLIDPTNGIVGAPDIIVEVISPSSVKADKKDKKALYLEFGVKEFWLVDPVYQTLSLFILNNDQYELKQELFGEGKIESTVLPELNLDLKQVFA